MSTFTSELSLSYLDFATPLQPQLLGTYISARSSQLAFEGSYVSTVIGQPQVKGFYVTSTSAMDASSSTRGTYIS
jgi:hypothetical protein